MATLSAKRRGSLPKSSFGMPGSRKYPMPDKSHAANAKARAAWLLSGIGYLREPGMPKEDFGNELRRLEDNLAMSAPMGSRPPS